LSSWRRSLMIALGLRSGRPCPGPDWVVMVPATPLIGSALSPGRQDSAPECEAGAPPHIPGGCVVVLLRRTHHPASRKAQLDTTILAGLRDAPFFTDAERAALAQRPCGPTKLFG